MRVVDAILESRSFKSLFWTLAIVSVLLLAILFLQGTIHRVELALMDLKMRLRADSAANELTTPSKDIVILGIDRNTDQYIRNHPESGLEITIPRAKLAAVLNYLTDQGVKAVVLDLEFKDPRSGDTELSAAIRRNGHVYAADRMDYSLDSFERDVTQSIGLTTKSSFLLFDGLVRPYLTHLMAIRAQWMPFQSVGPLDLGMETRKANRVALVSLVNQLSKYLIHHPPLPSAARSLMASASGVKPVMYANLKDRALDYWCLNNHYTQSYANNPEFLKKLAQARLMVHLDQALPESTVRAMTTCYAFPVRHDIMSVLTGIGAPSIDYDEDAYIRSVPMFFRAYRGNWYTYLGIRPALDLLHINTISYQPGTVWLDHRRIPLWEDRQRVMINWRNPKWLVAHMIQDSEPHLDPQDVRQLRKELAAITPDNTGTLLGGGHIYRQISMIDVLRLAEGKTLSPVDMNRMYNIPFYPQSQPFSFKNKVVIIGNTVTDIHRTPMSNTTYGPEVVASVLDMFLHDHVFVQRAPIWIQWVLITIIAVGMAATVITFENITIGFAIGFLLVLFYWMINVVVFYQSGTVLDLAVPSLFLILALVGATLYRYYIHDREKHHLTNVFSKYVSPQIMNEIVKNPERALDNLKGGKKELTVLFSDLQGFTQQFENADPELMVAQLNGYFDSMTEIILRYGGTYDKYMGDSIMAFFGAPADVPSHAEMACRAALEMEQALEALNANWIQEGSKPLSHGIGISSGEMFVGNFGSKNIKNFTVMGSNVNLGARLEAYTRVAHWPIIISVRTRELAAAFIQVRDLGRIRVKGFTDTVQIYGLECMNETPEI